MQFKNSNLLIIISVILLAVAISCKDNSQKIISKNKFTNILIDIYLLEAQINSTTPNISKKKQDSLFLVLLRKHQIDTIKFKQNIKYYTKHPENYLQILIATRDSLHKIDSITIAKYGRTPITNQQLPEESLLNNMNNNIDSIILDRRNRFLKRTQQ